MAIEKLVFPLLLFSTFTTRLLSLKRNFLVGQGELDVNDQLFNATIHVLDIVLNGTNHKPLSRLRVKEMTREMWDNAQETEDRVGMEELEEKSAQSNNFSIENSVRREVKNRRNKILRQKQAFKQKRDNKQKRAKQNFLLPMFKKLFPNWMQNATGDPFQIDRSGFEESKFVIPMSSDSGRKPVANHTGTEFREPLVAGVRSGAMPVAKSGAKVAGDRIDTEVAFEGGPSLVTVPEATTPAAKVTPHAKKSRPFYVPFLNQLFSENVNAPTFQLDAGNDAGPIVSLFELTMVNAAPKRFYGEPEDKDKEATGGIGTTESVSVSGTSGTASGPGISVSVSGFENSRDMGGLKAKDSASSPVVMHAAGRTWDQGTPIVLFPGAVNGPGASVSASGPGASATAIELGAATGPLRVMEVKDSASAPVVMYDANNTRDQGTANASFPAEGSEPGASVSASGPGALASASEPGASKPLEGMEAKEFASALKAMSATGGALDKGEANVSFPGAISGSVSLASGSEAGASGPMREPGAEDTTGISEGMLAGSEAKYNKTAHGLFPGQFLEVAQEIQPQSSSSFGTTPEKIKVTINRSTPITTATGPNMSQSVQGSTISPDEKIPGTTTPSQVLSGKISLGSRSITTQNIQHGVSGVSLGSGSSILGMTSPGPNIKNTRITSQSPSRLFSGILPTMTVMELFEARSTKLGKTHMSTATSTVAAKGNGTQRPKMKLVTAKILSVMGKPIPPAGMALFEKGTQTGTATPPKTTVGETTTGGKSSGGTANTTNKPDVTQSGRDTTGQPVTTTK